MPFSSTSALLFGSIGAIAETSDVQRRAYNAALKSNGLDWEWDRETYSELLEQAGGKDRLSMLSAATAAGLDQNRIEKIHAKKTQTACDEIRKSGTKLRPGVKDLIAKARDKGMKVGFVTTTYASNIDAILDAADMARSDFDYIVEREDVEHGKPAPDAYHKALKAMNLSAANCVAVEDTANSVMSAKRAGIKTIATPGELTAGQDFWQADLVVTSLTDETGKLRAEILKMMD